MVEVFKTNVVTEAGASLVLKIIKGNLRPCRINFDLDDCDNILRVETEKGEIEVDVIITLISEAGYRAEVLSDEVNPETGSISLLSLQR